jgi:hypothetical protein
MDRGGGVFAGSGTAFLLKDGLGGDFDGPVAAFAGPFEVRAGVVEALEPPVGFFAAGPGDVAAIPTLAPEGDQPPPYASLWWARRFIVVR